MFAGQFEIHNCKQCGAPVDLPVSPKPWPWRIRNKDDLMAYVAGLAEEPLEWLLAFYLASDLRLIAVEPATDAEVGSVALDLGRTVCRAKQLGAAGFILLHNHPSGTARPSAADIALTRKLRRLSNDMDVPLLDHFILAGTELVRIDPPW